MSNNIVSAILSKAREAGLSFLLDKNKLKLKVPKNVVVDHELLLAIDENKEQIKSMLREQGASGIGAKHNLRITRADRDRAGHIPLSFGQERLWFIDRMQG